MTHTKVKTLSETVGRTERIQKKVKYKKFTALYIMLVPAVIYYLIYKYGAMFGVMIAFKDYNLMEGVFGSEWVGLDVFKQMFQMRSFFQVFANTCIIAFYKLIFGFPAPIIFAVFLNEITNIRFKKTVQTISYLPHFLSWVVLGSVFLTFFGPSSGPIGEIQKALGLPQVYILGDPNYFRGFLVISHIWKSVGWGSIIYLAALAGIDTELYEAAQVDGATRFKRIIHITLPGLTPTITIMLILAIGQMLNDDFDQIYNLYSPAVYSVADVLSTYVYRIGLIDLNYSLATAAGLFKNIIAFALILSANAITQKINDYGLW